MSDPGDATAGVIVRPPRRDDMPRVWEMLLGLARYERLEDEVTGNAGQLAADVFADPPRVHALVAERAARLVGYALFYPVYSSFTTTRTWWLEDLFVEDSERGRGTGRRLIGAVARACVDDGGTRLGWIVLDWNRPSLDFYDALGARPTEDTWLHYGVGGDALTALARDTAGS